MSIIIRKPAAAMTTMNIITIRKPAVAMTTMNIITIRKPVAMTTTHIIRSMTTMAVAVDMTMNTGMKKPLIKSFSCGLVWGWCSFWGLFS